MLKARNTSSKLRREYLSREKRKLLLEIKKKEVKTKRLLKITRYIRWPRALSTISRASLTLRKYVFTKTWKVAVTASGNCWIRQACQIRQGQLHCTDAGKILLLKQSWIGYTNHTPAAWYLYIAQEGRQMEAFAMWF